MRALIALLVAALRCVPVLFRSRQQQAIVARLWERSLDMKGRYGESFWIRAPRKSTLVAPAHVLQPM